MGESIKAAEPQMAQSSGKQEIMKKLDELKKQKAERESSAGETNPDRRAKSLERFKDQSRNKYYDISRFIDPNNELYRILPPEVKEVLIMQKNSIRNEYLCRLARWDLMLHPFESENNCAG